MKKILFSTAFLFALIAGNPEQVFAQACSVSGSTTTSGTAATACFTRAGNKVRVALTGTWTGTVDLQHTSNNGLSYRTLGTFTSNVAFDADAQSLNGSFHWFIRTRSSGTIAYSMYDVTKTYGRVIYSTIPIGPTAYSSFGSSVIGSATSSATASIFVSAPISPTGLAVLVGATGGTDKFIYALYDETGSLLATTDTAGTTVSSTANDFQRIAFTSTIGVIPAGRYYMLVQVNGTTATFRRIGTTYLETATGSVTSTTFGTIPTTIVPPTTPTTLYGSQIGPIGYLY
jgi:hypothetical protein